MPSGLLFVILLELAFNPFDGVGVDKADSASAETGASHTAAEHTLRGGNRFGGIDYHIELGTTDLVVVPKRGMAGVHQLPEARPIAALECLSRLNSTLILRDDVTGTAKNDWLQNFG